MCDILHKVGLIYLITIESLLFIKPQLIKNTQNILQFNQCSLDTFHNGRWQHFYGPGLTANRLTDTKNILMESQQFTLRDEPHCT
jgi:hypothetical protein